jgi:hypothetical protein
MGNGPSRAGRSGVVRFVDRVGTCMHWMPVTVAVATSFMTCPLQNAN